MNKRIKWIDVAKGMLIFLVILGHSHVNNILNMAINSFHMPAFFVLSGITFYIKDNFFLFFMRKLRTILLPYIIFSLILLFYQFLKTVFWEGYDLDFLIGLVSIVIPVSGRTTTNVYGLWFLPCLFLAELIMYWLNKLSKKRVLKSCGLFTLVCIASIVIGNLTETVSVVSILPIAVLFLIIGNLMRNVLQRIQRKSFPICIVSLLVLLITIGCNYNFSGGMIDLSSMTLGFWPIYILSGLFGSIFVCSLAMILEKIPLLPDIGRSSLYYYGLHYEILAVVEKLVEGVGCAIITIIILYPIISIYNKLKYLRKKKNDKCNCTNI